MENNKNNEHIGILTFPNAINYGAMLQAYALYKKCSEYNQSVDLINYTEVLEHEKEPKHKNYWKILWSVRFRVSKFFKTSNARQLKLKRFNDFQKEYLKINKNKCYNIEDLKNLEKDYDGFISGSDMVWTAMGQDLNSYFLKFTDYDKRGSYAPSLTGTSKLSKSDDEKMKENINGIKFLSFREQEGINYSKKICNREAFLALDPTLLYSKEEWAKLLDIKLTQKEKYILCYMFNGVPIDIDKKLRKIAKKHNMHIRYIPMSISENYEEIKNGFPGGYGPKEFVELFLNASFIVTNTYHGLMFSLISEKPFVVIHREKGNKWKANEERMNNILRMVNQENRYLDLQDDISEDFLINSEQDIIKNIISCRRKESIEYLTNMIDGFKLNKKKNKALNNISEISKNNCTGCTSCLASCPFHAISMKENQEGFLYPIIDKMKCKNCGVCIKHCPTLIGNLNKVKDSYYGYSKFDEREKSASGGAFYTIANYFIKEKKAVIYGCTLNNNNECEHIEITNINELYKLQNSKYIQSNLKNTFSKVKQQLENERYVLFSGTPCQVAGLYSFLEKQYDRLYTIDIICHGVPSPKLWKYCLQNNEFIKFDKSDTQNGNSNFEITFRNKDNSKKYRSAFEYKINLKEKNKVKKIKGVYDLYYSNFLNGDTYRMSCYYCKYANINRVGDITLGDCDSWREQERFNDSEAKSVILINSDKGTEIWKNVERHFENKKLILNKEIAINNNLREPTKLKDRRRVIYKDMDNLTWKEFSKNYKPRKKHFVGLKIIILKILKK